MTSWMPCPPKAEFGGLVFLPRLIDKARRKLEGDQAGQDLISPYMYGDNDWMDVRVLRFLGLNDQDVLGIVREEPDNDLAAQVILAKSGKDRAACEAYSKKLLRQEWYVFLMIEADEELRPPGLVTSLIKTLYLGLVFPVVFWVFNRQEAQRDKAARGMPLRREPRR